MNVINMAMKDRFYRRCGTIRKIIKWLKCVINKYELTHPQYEEPIHICNSCDTRNRYK